MQQTIKDRFQQWTNEVSQDNKLILTNDLDSLFTVAVLKHLFGCEVGMFYDFKRLYSTEKKFDKQTIIGCDLSLEDPEMKTFCNHVTRMAKDDAVNPLSANLNNLAKIYGGKYNSTYFKKYNGSTALTVLSLYDAFDKLLLPNHTELTDIQKKILVSIDSYFWGAYHPKHYEAYDYFIKWQQGLELEFFNDIYENNTKEELIQFQYDNRLKKTISVVNVEGETKLQTGLDIEFLQEHFPMLDFDLDITFTSQCTFDNPVRDHYYTGESKHGLTGRVFSLSVINRDKVVYTKFPE